MPPAQVLEGYGRMMVTAVGLNSAQGQILGSISGAAPSAPGDGLRCATTPCSISQSCRRWVCIMGVIRSLTPGTGRQPVSQAKSGVWQ